MDIKLKKFDMRQIKDDKVVVLIGKRETGKSFLVRDLLYYHRDIPIGTVISPTESANAFYEHLVPPLFIHDDFSPEIVANVVKRQKMVTKAMKDEIREGGSSNIDPRSFLILDDCLYDNSWTKDTNIRYIFTNGRHTHNMLVITSQFALGIPPILRTNIDFVFILRENIISNRKRLYDHYAGMLPTFDIFCQVMDQCTEDYGCLVVNNNSKSNILEDQVFWYKAAEAPDFKLGADEFWDYHKQNYNPDPQNDNYEHKPTGKGPRVNVKKQE